MDPAVFFIEKNLIFLNNEQKQLRLIDGLNFIYPV